MTKTQNIGVQLLVLRFLRNTNGTANRPRKLDKQPTAVTHPKTSAMPTKVLANCLKCH